MSGFRRPKPAIWLVWADFDIRYDRAKASYFASSLSAPGSSCKKLGGILYFDAQNPEHIIPLGVLRGFPAAYTALN
jgi:hypothetical protein